MLFTGCYCRLGIECVPRYLIVIGSLAFFTLWPFSSFTHILAICRYPTGLATNASGTRRISASFRKKPTSTLQRRLLQPRTQWLQLCRTTRPTRPPRQIPVRIGCWLPAQPRQPCATKPCPTGQETRAMLRTQRICKGGFILKYRLVLGMGEWVDGQSL